MSIYQFDDYKTYFNDWVGNQPRKGFGEYRRVALSLNVSTTMVSQVFKGEKHLSLELAADLCDYLRLDEEETDFFLLLVELNRAGSHKLQQRFRRQVKARQEKAKKLENRIKNASVLSDEAKSMFYSSWEYSGIRMLIDVPGWSDPELIAQRLHLPRNHVQRVLEFLLQHQLIAKEKNHYKIGPARTHLATSSPLSLRSHQNWRLRALQQMSRSGDDAFFYSGPMTLSEEVAAWIRQELPTFVEKLNGKIIPSPSETIRCLNIDWFEY